MGQLKPVAAVLDCPPRFAKLGRGEQLPSGVQWAIGAGPNLVSVNATTGASYVDIEGDNVNIVEHASNTALALRAPPSGGAGAGAGADATAVEMMFVTFDGEDNCTEYKPTCGVDSRQFAAFLLDYLEVNTAMEMDQGGSTAMWVKGQPRDGIVSNPTVAERELFNGVFLGVPASSLQPKASQPRGG